MKRGEILVSENGRIKDRCYLDKRQGRLKGEGSYNIFTLTILTFDNSDRRRRIVLHKL